MRQIVLKHGRGCLKKKDYCKTSLILALFNINQIHSSSEFE